MTKIIKIEEAIRNPQQFVAELTYVSYRYNRDLAKEFSLERWARMYGPETAAMEQRYQAERAQA
jgi:hypothetical protein